MAISVGDVAAIAALVLLVVVVAAPIVWFIRRTFEAHDPARARAMVEVGSDGTFELAWAGGGALWFRFEIDGDTDSEYDLVVSGELVGADGASRRFGWRTADTSAVASAAATQRVGTTYAVTTRRGSIELASLPDTPCVARGRVESGVADSFRRGWVYVPAPTT